MCSQKNNVISAQEFYQGVAAQYGRLNAGEISAVEQGFFVNKNESGENIYGTAFNIQKKICLFPYYLLLIAMVVFFVYLSGEDSSSSERTSSGGLQSVKMEKNELIIGLKNCISNGTCLKQGDEGSIVVLLQEALIQLGYSCGNGQADGKFGSGTFRSLKKFQADHGLTADGIAGVNTLKALAGAL